MLWLHLKCFLTTLNIWNLLHNTSTQILERLIKHKHKLLLPGTEWIVYLRAFSVKCTFMRLESSSFLHNFCSSIDISCMKKITVESLWTLSSLNGHHTKIRLLSVTKSWIYSIILNWHIGLSVQLWLASKSHGSMSYLRRIPQDPQLEPPNLSFSFLERGWTISGLLKKHLSEIPACILYIILV